MEHSPHYDRSELRAQHQQLLTETVGRLEREFSKYFTSDTLEHYVQDSYEELASKAEVLTHVPAFVERFAFDRLRALAKTSQDPVAISPDVLFVCERNDAASQMAATLFNRATGGRAKARSAGRKPAGRMAEAAVSAMQEIGIEMLGNFPKPVTPEIEAASDIIVTMDVHDDVAVLEGKHFEAWELPHPSTDDIDSFRTLRNEIDDRVRDLIDRLVPNGVRKPRSAFDLDLKELRLALSLMTRRVVELAQRLGPAVLESDSLALQAIIEEDAAINTMDSELTTHVFELIALRQPVARDLRAILAVHDTSLHLERIADCLVDTATTALAEDLTLPSELAEMSDRVAKATELSIDALQEGSVERAREVVQQVEVLEQIRRQLLEQLMDSGGSADRKTALAADQASIALKRAGGHALDIAEQTLFAVKGERVELNR
jgi:phosphate uptake regulator/protein-tyrosine-phosphatase